MVHFRAGEQLTREGDDVEFYWLLLSGSVRVYYTSVQGFEVTVKIFAAPAAWAEMQILTDHRHTEDCVCVEDAVCLCIPKAFFSTFLDAHPAFMRQVLIDTSARFLIAAQNERALAFLTVAERLAHLLLSYVRIYGEDAGRGIRITVRLSHEQLAADLGVVKKSITRTLSQWTEEGVVDKDGPYYLIPDLMRLVELSPKGLIGVDDRVAQRTIGDVHEGVLQQSLADGPPRLHVGDRLVDPAKCGAVGERRAARFARHASDEPHVLGGALADEPQRHRRTSTRPLPLLLYR